MTMRVPIEIGDRERAAFERYCGRKISDTEIRERLSDVLRCYLSDALGVKP